LGYLSSKGRVKINKKQKFTNWLQYLFFKDFFFLVRITPAAWGRWVGKKLGLLAFKIMKSRQILTVENIRAAREYGRLRIDCNDYNLAKQAWGNLGIVGSESLYYYARTPKQIKKVVTLEGAENLQKVLAKQKGVIMVMAHIGNWELLGIYLSMTGYQLSPIVQTQSNALLDKILQEKRHAVGMKTIPKMSFLRPIIQAFNRNEIVPFLIDQDAGTGGVYVDFFGREASIPRGPAEFAIKTGTPVVFAYIVRENSNLHRLIISEEIPIKNTGNYKQDLLDNTAMFSSFIEKVVSQYPNQWLWMHKLWPSEIKV
jgi:Kdo2-lipid IVA lauroyltransferase/acyltransferase